MSVPNLKHIVEAVHAEGWDFTTKDGPRGFAAYGNAVVYALHVADPDFGHLLKAPGATHCLDPRGRRRACDAALYKPTGQAVDFAADAGFGTPPPSNRPVWLTGDPVGKYGPEKWFAPVPNSGTTQPNPGTPPPPDDLAPRVAALEAALAGLRAELTGKADAARVEAVNQRLEAVDQQTYKKGAMPTYAGSFFGIAITSTAQE